MYWYLSCRINRIGTLETPYGYASIIRDRYRRGGSPSVRLIDFDDGERMATLSVKLPDQNHLLGQDEFFVKTWKENAVYLPLVLATGLFEVTGRFGDAGLVRAPIWRFAERVSD
jgi:hypothetical protein